MGSEFGAISEDPEGGFIKFVVKRASKQDQTLHMEEKLHIILYFRSMFIVIYKWPNFFASEFTERKEWRNNTDT